MQTHTIRLKEKSPASQNYKIHVMQKTDEPSSMWQTKDHRPSREKTRNTRAMCEGLVAAPTCSVIDPMRSFLHTSEPYIIPVSGMCVGSDSGSLAQRTYRTFHVGKSLVQIAEDIGNSIDRHVWDAGVILSSFISYEIDNLGTSQLMRDTDKNILELGTGCGIVGITAAIATNANIVCMTDLVTAVDIVTTNISNNMRAIKGVNAYFEVYDWSKPVSKTIASTPWDLIIMSDGKTLPKWVC